MFAQSAPLFQDRNEVGRRLASRLGHYAGSNAIVVALPRGGVVVGSEIATALDLPLEVLVVRKIGHPSNPEFGVAAVAEGGAPVWDREVLRALRVTTADLKPRLMEEEREVARRARVYREGRGFPEVKGRIVLLVDDGTATGNTLRAAIASLRFRGVRRIAVAVGVAPAEVAKELRRTVEEWVCLATPGRFSAVGQFYRHFDPVDDGEVLELLRRARHANVDPVMRQP